MKPFYSLLLGSILLFNFSAIAALVNYPLKDFSWRTKTIPVCFESPTFDPLNIQESNPWSYYNYRAEIQAWTTSELKGAGLELVNWNDCYEDDKQSLRINIMLDSWGSAYAQYLGKKSQGIYAGLSIVYDRNENPEWYPRFFILHEILHTLGFHHEQERPDSHGCDYLRVLKGEYASGLLSLGNFDPDSIMNYCTFDRHPLPQDHASGLLLDQKIGRLTEIDKAALLAYLFEPVAEVVNPLKINSNRTTYIFQVSGASVQSYYYQFGLADKLNCENSSSYIGPQLVSEGLTVSMPKKGRYKLCLLGSDGVNRQNLKAYSSYVWTKTTQSIAIANSIELTPFNAKIPLKIISANDSIYMKVVQHKDFNTCSNTGGYKKMDVANLTLIPSAWVKLNRDEYGYFESDFYVCVTHTPADAKKGDFDSEHFIIIEDGLSFTGISNELRNGDKVKALAEHNDGTFTHYKFALVPKADDCLNGSHYGQPVPGHVPVSFTYNSDLTRFICGLALDKFGNWTPLELAGVKELTLTTDH